MIGEGFNHPHTQIIPLFILSSCLNCFILLWLFTGTARMELLLDNATFQIYILYSPGHFQVIWVTYFFLEGKFKLTNLNTHAIFTLSGLRFASSGQIHVAVWQTPSVMLCPSFMTLRRSMVVLTLYFTRERTARWIETFDFKVGLMSWTTLSLLIVVFIYIVKYLGTEWCQAGAPVPASVPSWWWSSRHGRVLSVSYFTYPPRKAHKLKFYFNLLFYCYF